MLNSVYNKRNCQHCLYLLQNLRPDPTRIYTDELYTGPYPPLAGAETGICHTTFSRGLFWCMDLLKRTLVISYLVSLYSDTIEFLL